jgi:23S rRNA (guanosine2251-2'-O)-methyltransferase
VAYDLEERGEMTKRRKKGPSQTPKAEDRHWYARHQRAKSGRDGVAARRARPPASGPGPGSATRRSTGSAEPAGSGRPGGSGGAGAPPGTARSARPGANRAAPRGGAGGDRPEIVAGRNAVVEALRAGLPATALYVLGGAVAPRDERVREAIELASAAGVPLLEAGRAELDRMTEGAVHQGIAVEAPPYEYAHPADLPGRAGAATAAASPLIVALDGVTDPRNLGAVVRSTAAFGGHGVVVPARRAAGVSAAAWKASAGTIAAVPVARATNLTRTLRDYQAEGLFVAGLDAAGEVGVDAMEIATEPLVLVVGSEGRGLSRLVAQTCDLVVRVPMAGSVESLNAGVAAGIALYEIARHRAG